MAKRGNSRKALARRRRFIEIGAMISWLTRFFGKAAHEREGPVPAIGFFRDDILLFTGAGFYILNANEFDELRRIALTPNQQSEYRKILMYANGRELRRLRLENKLCRAFALQRNTMDEVIMPWRRYFGESTLDQGFNIALGAIGWTWSRFGEFRGEVLANPSPGILLDGGNQKIFIPQRALESIVIWPTKAVFRYDRRAIHLDLLEPEWTEYDH